MKQTFLQHSDLCPCVLFLVFDIMNINFHMQICPSVSCKVLNYGWFVLCYLLQYLCYFVKTMRSLIVLSSLLPLHLFNFLDFEGLGERRGECSVRKYFYNSIVITCSCTFTNSTKYLKKDFKWKIWVEL